MNDTMKQQYFSSFGKQSKLKGVFHLAGDTYISSQVEGEIVMEDSSSILNLEMSSSFNGKINCFDLNVYGKIDGEIHSKGKVTIYPTAVITGKVFAKSLQIHPGACLNLTGHAES